MLLTMVFKAKGFIETKGSTWVGEGGGRGMGGRRDGWMDGWTDGFKGWFH